MKEPSSSRSSSWRGRAVLRHDYKLVFRPALAQALVAVIALTGGKHQAPVSSVSEIMISNGFFVALWLGSACCSGRPPMESDLLTNQSIPSLALTTHRDS